MGRRKNWTKLLFYTLLLKKHNITLGNYSTTSQATFTYKHTNSPYFVSSCHGKSISDVIMQKQSQKFQKPTLTSTLCTTINYKASETSLSTILGFKTPNSYPRVLKR